ncbi:MAG: TetR/AcrR family transcriptional regulator [Polyangiaceae bacterium]|nr:TetR/AcrR family transcriptional regulator [Polyangiaceae bacterium]
MPAERRPQPPFRPGRVPEARPGPSGGRRDSNRAERAAALCVAAVRLFRERGLDAVRVDDIAREAGVAKGSFYRYFADQAQLVEAVFEPVASRAAEALGRCEARLDAARSRAHIAGAYRQLAAELAGSFLDSPEVVALYLQESRGPPVGARRPIRALADQLARRAIALTAVAQRTGWLRPLPPEVTAEAVIGAAEALAHGLLAGRITLPPSAAAEALVEMVLGGVAASPATRGARPSSARRRA